MQWGKLLVNLNNAINALSGLPLREQLAQRGWRRLLADQIAEGLTAVRAEGIQPVSPTPVALSLVPHLLRLPDAFLRRAGAGHEDRSAGALVDVAGPRMAAAAPRSIIFRASSPTSPTGADSKVPLSRRIVALIRDAEAGGKGSPRLTVAQIRLP